MTTVPSASASNPSSTTHPSNASNPASALYPTSGGHSGGILTLSKGEVKAPLEKLQPSHSAASTSPTIMQGTTSHPALSTLSKNPDRVIVASQGCGNFSDDTGIIVMVNFSN